MSGPITREMFINPDHVKIAIESASTMFAIAEDSIQQVPLPPSVKETGILPDGYTVDFVFDPITLVAALAKQGVTTQDQLKPELVAELKQTINAPDNLNIVPISLQQDKLLAIQATHESTADGNEEEEEEEANGEEETGNHEASAEKNLDNVD